MLQYIDNLLGSTYNSNMRTLLEISIGEIAKIIAFDKSVSKANFMRFALYEGQTVQCIAKPGPIVIKENHQVVAIGNNYSKNIYISDNI